jgi:1,2-phenylacetyl-CoA epoxidase PaaB subunit
LQVYEVLARARREEPLRQIGSVTADSMELARVYAYKTYDEEPWIEMVVVPRAAFATVIHLEPGVGRDAEEGAK